MTVGTRWVHCMVRRLVKCNNHVLHRFKMRSIGKSRMRLKIKNEECQNPHDKVCHGVRDGCLDNDAACCGLFEVRGHKRPNENKISYRRSAARWLLVGLWVCKQPA